MPSLPARRGKVFSRKRARKIAATALSASFDLLVILGPTASGKTRAGVEVARALNGEIISADSRQVYRGMDLGTGKDLKEYGAVPYHLIDIVDAGYEFSVFEFQRRFAEAYRAIRERGRVPLLVGGTGMYLDAVLRGYCMAQVPENPSLRHELQELSMEALADRLLSNNPRLHNTTDLLDRKRLVRAIEIAAFQAAAARQPTLLGQVSPVAFGLHWARKALHERIARRLKERLQEGLIEEVARLHREGLSWEKLDFYGLEYRFVARYLRGELKRNDLLQKLAGAIRQLAKKQETWFRRMERQGILIHWVEGSKEPARAILQYLRRPADLEM